MGSGGLPHVEPTAFSVVVIAGAAFVLPLLARRLRLPAIVLEILFGLIVGPSVIGLIEESEVIGFLAELGFLLLMFLSGFELDFGRLERQGPAHFVTGGAVFAVTLGLAFYASSMIGQGPFVAFLLATTSLGLVVPTLRDTRRSATAFGQVVLISALLADFLTLIAVTFYAMLQQYGPGWKLLNFPVLFFVIAATLLGVRRIAWWYPEKFERLFAAHDPEEMGIRSCLALMFVFAGLSDVLGVEPILGAFLAGLTFAMVFRRRGQLEQKLNGFSYGFLIPFFFIHVGMQFDIRALRQREIFVGALILIGLAVAVKLAAALVLAVRRFSPREVLAGGVLLSARLSLVIAVADLGMRLNLIDRTLKDQVILLALVTSMLAPAAFRLILPPLPGKATPPPRAGQEAVHDLSSRPGEKCGLLGAGLRQ